MTQECSKMMTGISIAMSPETWEKIKKLWKIMDDSWSNGPYDPDLFWFFGGI